MKKYWHILFVLICIFGLFSCTEEEKTGSDIYLVGDSIIKAWNLDASFSNHKIHNHGINGARLETVKGFTVGDSTSWIICILGTNDLQYGMTEVQRQAYADDYLSTVRNFGGKQIILFSVLPSSMDNRNEQIPYFNDLIRLKVQGFDNIHYIDVYKSFLAGDGISIKNEYTKDGLHLNQTGYNLLTNELKEIIRDL